jgi:hypothetical protein
MEIRGGLSQDRQARWFGGGRGEGNNYGPLDSGTRTIHSSNPRRSNDFSKSGRLAGGESASLCRSAMEWASIGGAIDIVVGGCTGVCMPFFLLMMLMTILLRSFLFFLSFVLLSSSPSSPSRHG